MSASWQSSDVIGARLDELERKMERLRALYESFFLGVERRPPQVPRQELNRLMLETQQVSIRNAGLRFRYQSLAQRWTLLTTYWNRTFREIEAGTYRRDLQKAYRRLANRGQPLTEAEAAALGIPAGRAKAFVEQQNRRWGTEQPPSPPDPTAAAPQAVAAPPAPAPPGITRTAAPPPAEASGDPEVDLAALQRDYAAAHRQLALAGPAPTADRLRAKVLPYLDRLRAAHPGARLTAQVVVENGRVLIRAKPKV